MKPAKMLASDVDPSFVPLEPPPAARSAPERPPFPTTLKAYARAKFDWIRQITFDTSLTPFQARVGNCLAMYHNMENGYAHPSHIQIAEALGSQGARGVKAAIDALIVRGHLYVEYSRGAGNANRYFLVLKRRVKPDHFPVETDPKKVNGHAPF
jgi:hypothetical protein